MNVIRYEPVFGDQRLFNGAPEDAEFAGWFCQEIRWYMIHDGLILFSDGGTWCTSDNPYISSDIAAMRRIIPAPKRWTQADKDAGRLPDVGCKCRQGSKDEIVVAVTGKFVVTECQDMSVCTTRNDVFIRSYKPIESPEEKAARLREEWVDSAITETEKRKDTTTDEYERLKARVKDIYDAILSGDLPVPVKDAK